MANKVINPKYGKYKAIVTNINDNVDNLEKMGRVKVKCPAIWGESESNWCQVCVPFASAGAGFWFVPSINDLVWIEFEGGDTRLPIITGGWFKAGSTPVSGFDDYTSSLKRYRILTPKGNLIELDDLDGEEQIRIVSKDNTSVSVGVGRILISGDVVVNGNINASGSISDAGGSI